MSGNKRELRNGMKRILKEIESEKIHLESVRCQEKILHSTLYTSSHGICLYLSMKNELQTNLLLQTALFHSKKVYIPKVIGSERDQMEFHEIHSMEQIHNFPKSSWGIPEPPNDSQCSTDYAQYLDVVFLPGVAFDSECKRLGHGKGYYDTFLTSLTKQCEELGKPKPTFVGIALDEQIVESVPTESHDIHLDHVVTPSWVFSKSVDHPFH